MTTATPSIADTLFADLEPELARTRKALERYPAQDAGWRPHEKSMPIGRLAVHLATLPGFAKSILEGDELDFAANPYTPPAFSSAADLVAIFDETARSIRPVVAAADAAALDRPWTLRAGDHVILTGRKADLIRELMISHMIHHRAQLGVYYRLLGVPVPRTYGPSADEAM